MSSSWSWNCLHHHRHRRHLADHSLSIALIVGGSCHHVANDLKVVTYRHLTVRHPHLDLSVPIGYLVPQMPVAPGARKRMC